MLHVATHFLLRAKPEFLFIYKRFRPPARPGRQPFSPTLKKIRTVNCRTVGSRIAAYTFAQRKENAVTRRSTIATVSACRRIERLTDASAFGGASQVATNYSLIVVCMVFVLFALAGYAMAELSMPLKQHRVWISDDARPFE